MEAYGIEVDPCPGVDVGVFTRTPPDGPAILHASTVRLPPARGDMGSGVVERLAGFDFFLVLFEYEASAAGSGVFARSDPPWPVRAEDFSPARLRRPLAGQSGCQYFFTTAGRPFMLYVVVGSHLLRETTTARANAFLKGVRIRERLRAPTASPGEEGFEGGVKEGFRGGLTWA
jgi:hypothetical protein